MKLIKFGVRDDYGKEYYLFLFSTKRYSLLQAEFDIGVYSKWTELPYLNITMGQGRLFSVLLTASKFGFSMDFLGRNWRDSTYYDLPPDT
jgi:hypothetical protein